MKVIAGGVTAPVGFLANGLSSGIKKSGAFDLALVYSTVPAKACGVFTKNKIQAAPVKLSKAYLQKGYAQAIIANSGNANCFTGKKGIDASRKMSIYAAKELGIKEQDVLVASTGIIGKELPIKLISAKAKELVLGLAKDKHTLAAKAIMTTDTKPKEIAVVFNIGGKVVKIGAMVKGVGMIAPNMATMLCFVTTDACIESKALKLALSNSVNATFNSISIDGEMSTNDSVLILANGLAFNQEIKLNSTEYKVFDNALKEVCLKLSEEVIRDAEGATKFIKIVVNQARSAIEARNIGLRIANSVLFKTAMFGENPNFGRIVQALGETDCPVKEENIRVTWSNLKKKDICIKLFLGLGKCSGMVYTCDLSKKYVDINAGYN